MTPVGRIHSPNRERCFILSSLYARFAPYFHDYEFIVLALQLHRVAAFKNLGNDFKHLIGYNDVRQSLALPIYGSSQQRQL